MKTFIGKDGFRFLDEREVRLKTRWFHYSPPETFSHMFRSPDWFLWKDGRFRDAIDTMQGFTGGAGREVDRTRIWADNGVSVVRLQVLDAESLREPVSPLNYLITYLTVTHPEEDRVLIDADECAAKGIDLPDVDFLIHDDDLVITKYEGAPRTMHRDAYFNTEPAPGQDDDRPMFAYYAGLAEHLLAHRDDLTYTGPLFGLGLLHDLGLT